MLNQLIYNENKNAVIYAKIGTLNELNKVLSAKKTSLRASFSRHKGFLQSPKRNVMLFKMFCVVLRFVNIKRNMCFR